MGGNPLDPTPVPPGPLRSMIARLLGVRPADTPPTGSAATASSSGEPSAGMAARVTGGTSAADGEGRVCPHCGSARTGEAPYCGTCGWVFPGKGETRAREPERLRVGERIAGRYEVVAFLGDRQGVERYRAWDHASTGSAAAAVVLLRGRPAPAPEALPVAEEVAGSATLAGAEDVMVSTSEDLGISGSQATTEILRVGPPWPTLAWERAVLGRAQHPSLPAILDGFAQDGWEYLVEEAPRGRSFWDAWDDPATTNRQRYAWLAQVADALRGLHRADAILEGLRPELLVLTEEKGARLADVSDLLPAPLPPDTPVRGSLYSAPELSLAPESVDARADLYSFGAMLYALHVGRELADSDFERPGVPQPFLPRFPDAHPLFGRLLSKTFCRDVAARFPSDEASREDPTGFTELTRTLEACGRALDRVRLEIAAWTTTGMVRTGNEDALAVLHAAESHQDDLEDRALLLLADGMGGYEAGEVAAALALGAIRDYLLPREPFAALVGGMSNTRPTATGSPPAPEESIREALKHANREVHQAARSGVGRRGMGCTAEVVYLDGRDLFVGHVGDSRTYHLHEGRLEQVTRDHTLVNRLMELGAITAEEAQTHPRRSELQQAIGGHAEVDADISRRPLDPGDWVVVCSDGLSNHISAAELQQMLQSEATSAEMAARRLVNFANIKGATDNATVIVVRIT